MENQNALVSAYMSQADFIRVPMDLPDEVRTGKVGVGDILLEDPVLGRSIIHEYVHHLQTTTTLSGIRLFHYYWENCLNLLSSFDDHVKSLVANGRTIPEALSQVRSPRGYQSPELEICRIAFRRFSLLYGETTRCEQLTCGPFVGGPRVSCRIEDTPDPGKPHIVSPRPVLKAEYPDGATYDVLFGAHHIREACARAIEFMFLERFFKDRAAAAVKTLAAEPINGAPDTRHYHFAYHLYMAHVKEKRFHDLLTFAAVCELALMYDRVLVEFTNRIDDDGHMTRFDSPDEEKGFWWADFGPGLAFVHLIRTVNENGAELSTPNWEEGGEEFYTTLSELAAIPISSVDIQNAQHMLESPLFLFRNEDWNILFDRVHQRLRRGLQLRLKWRTKPLLAFILLHDQALFREILDIRVLTLYDNTIVGPSSDTEELTLLVFQNVVRRLIRKGTTMCLIKRDYPRFCARSATCNQGDEVRFSSMSPKLEFYCPYAKGMIPLQRWLSPAGEEPVFPQFDRG